MTKAELSKLMRIIKIPYTLLIGLFHNILTPLLLILLILMVFDYQQRESVFAFVDTEIIESVIRCNDKTFNNDQWKYINESLEENDYSGTRLQVYVIANRHGFCGDKVVDISDFNMKEIIEGINR